MGFRTTEPLRPAGILGRYLNWDSGDHQSLITVFIEIAIIENILVRIPREIKLG